ncbi:MAG: PAS domain-containing protein [Nibricoccus sp.]
MAIVTETVAKAKAGPPRAPRPLDSDATVLEEYTHRLSLKLELKVAELEGANDDLRASEHAIRDLNEQLKETVRALENEVGVRKEAEAALRIREEVLRYAQNLGQTGSYVRDLDTMDMIWSDEAFRICGFEPIPGPVSRDWLAERIHPEDRERVLGVLRAADKDRTGLEVEHRILRPDGGVRHIFVRRHIYRDADGKPRRAIGIIQDITDRRQAELQRTRLENQLRQAQKMEAIGNLAGGIAHDFNNILTAIMAHAELLDLELPRETTGPHLRDSVHEILMASGRARDMVRQILTFSRKQPVERKRIEIDAVVQEALKLVRVTLPPSVELRTELKAQRAVMANEAQIHQIVLNLCTNAAQAMGTTGGMISVTLSVAELDETRARSRPPLRTGEHVLLEIRDNGCGMDAATVERIFGAVFHDEGSGSWHGPWARRGAWSGAGARRSHLR